MKRIVIKQENNVGEIILYDKNYSDLAAYSLEISEIMKETEITILKTTSGTVILKPSKISSIDITEVSDTEFPKNVESSDIITDSDEKT